MDLFINSLPMENIFSQEALVATLRLQDPEAQLEMKTLDFNLTWSRPETFSTTVNLTGGPSIDTILDSKFGVRFG